MSSSCTATTHFCRHVPPGPPCLSVPPSSQSLGGWIDLKTLSRRTAIYELTDSELIFHEGSGECGLTLQPTWRHCAIGYAGSQQATQLLENASRCYQYKDVAPRMATSTGQRFINGPAHSPQCNEGQTPDRGRRPPESVTPILIQSTESFVQTSCALDT